MFSLKNKKQNGVVFVLALLVFSSGMFFFGSTAAHAGPVDWMGEQVLWALKQPLYYIYVAFGWLASVAVTIFGWAVDPNYISGSDGLLNRNSVYVMWKFIRDFFNLFFILTLLYTAFTIVFQVASNYKKTLLSLVLAALFVNFSFPITRVIIDVTNVPMYYFLNQMGSSAANQKSYLGTVLSASQLKSILIPGSEIGREKVDFDKVGFSQLIMAIIFIFIFSITLLVLAVMMVVRLAALIILLIFSSVGFAASVIPGMSKYGSMWWDKLSQYALFGPASMLMLYIATQFFAEIAQDNTKAQFLKYGIQSGTTETAGFISSMAMFTIPIVMLWMAIGLAVSSSIIGAVAVVGLGYGAIKGAGKALAYRNPVSNIARGAGKGVKEGLYKGKLFGADYGKTKYGKLATGKYWAAPSKLEAGTKGFVSGGGKGVKSELQRMHDEQVNKAVKENKENQVNRSTMLQMLGSNDKVTRHAAAVSMAEAGEIRTSDDLKKAILALRSNDDEKNPEYNESASDLVLKAIDKAKDGATAGVDPALYQRIANSAGGYAKKADGKTDETNDKGEKIVGSTLEMLDGKLKKDGNLHIKVDYKVEEKINEARAQGKTLSREDAQKEVYDKIVLPLNAEDLVKQAKLHEQPGFKQYFSGQLANNPKRIEAILDKAVEKGKPEVQAMWVGIAAENDLVKRKSSPKTEGSAPKIEVVEERTPRSRTTFPNT